MKIRFRWMTLNGKKTLHGVLSLYGYHFCDILGTGDFGTCYEVSRNGELYVFKAFKKNHVKRRKSKLAIEIKLLNEVKHRGIPCVFKVIDRDGIYGFIMKKMPGDTLEDLLNWDYAFSKPEIISVMSQLIEMIWVLHAGEICHRDIKTTNILMYHGSISLIDFGSARKLHSHPRIVNPDFWGIGDVFMRLAIASPELSSHPENLSIQGLSLDTDERNVIKRLLGIESPYHDAMALRHDFDMAFISNQ